MSRAGTRRGRHRAPLRRAEILLRLCAAIGAAALVLLGVLATPVLYLLSLVPI